MKVLYTITLVVEVVVATLVCTINHEFHKIRNKSNNLEYENASTWRWYRRVTSKLCSIPVDTTSIWKIWGNRSGSHAGLILFYILIIPLVTGIFTVAMIENTITSNNLQGVREMNTTGQYIPFLFGCIILIRSLSKIWKSYKTRKPQELIGVES
jgi:hypothetical protein